MLSIGRGTGGLFVLSSVSRFALSGAARFFLKHASLSPLRGMISLGLEEGLSFRQREFVLACNSLGKVGSSAGSNRIKTKF